MRFVRVALSVLAASFSASMGWASVPSVNSASTPALGENAMHDADATSFSSLIDRLTAASHTEALQDPSNEDVTLSPGSVRGLQIAQYACTP